MKISLPYFFAGFILSIHATALHSRELNIASLEWPPYYSANLHNGGVLTDIVTQAFKRAGHTPAIKYYPWKRAVSLAETARADILVGAYYSKEAEESFLFSQPFYSTYVGLVALKSLGVEEYKNLEDLSSYRIGINNGYTYGKEFSEADFLSKHTISNAQSSILMLFSDRLHLVAMPFNVFTYELNKIGSHNALNQKGINDIVYLYPPLTRYSLHIAVSRNLKDHKTLISDFNKGLISLKSDGTYNDILKAHGF